MYIYRGAGDPVKLNLDSILKASMMDKLFQAIVWTLSIFIVTCGGICFELPEFGRKCKCPSVNEIKCLGASLGRLPRVKPEVERQVVSLILWSNLITSISDEDLVGYSALKKLDLRLQRTGETCVADFRRRAYPNLIVQGLCSKVCIPIDDNYVIGYCR